MLSKEFIETLDRMNIRVYNLSGDIQLIGQLVEAHESAIEAKNVLELRRIILEDDSMATIMIPYIPFGSSESLIIYRASIMTESPASLVLKKRYCDSLLVNKLNSLVGDLDCFKDNQDSLFDNQEPNKENANFNWQNLKNQYPNRNWNN